MDVLGSLGELTRRWFQLLHCSRWWRFSTSLLEAKSDRRRGGTDDSCGGSAYFPHLNPESIEIFIGMVMLRGSQ